MKGIVLAIALVLLAAAPATAGKAVTAALKRDGDRLVASGRAPSGMELTVRLVGRGRTVDTARTTAAGGRWRVVFDAPRRIRYTVKVVGSPVPVAP
ncbi:MAG: hypothetical protein HZB46_12145 [Solirubrobacterales bacterium]|nr:hypothetical protein [Solirubrobacterales bacterium]